MALRLTLPFGREDNVKNLVFSILTKEYPLKIVELTNLIRKRYGKSVTFQAVRKAILELVEEGVLIKKDKEFSINKKWIFETKKKMDEIYSSLSSEEKSPKNIQSIEGDVSVFTFESLNEMMRFWEEIVDDWFRTYKKGDYNVNCWQGVHGWEILMHPEPERKIMTQLNKKGILCYVLSTSNTALDKYVAKFYTNMNVKVGLSSSNNNFDKTYYVGTYGETIVQAHYPAEILDALDKFFKKTKNIDDLNLHELSKIVNRKVKIKLTVIKNLSMAQQINKSIISQID
ncbi:MAG: hypothetical protein WC758_02855 [Candidatus Woesearchaeota archaeon]|jgi:hypothetical protein